MHWIKWGRIYKPKEEVGLGIKNFTENMLAIKLKLAWRVENHQNIWTELVRSIHGELDMDYRNNKCLARWATLQDAWRIIKDNLDSKNRWI
jgi:hypothetical protein